MNSLLSHQLHSLDSSERLTIFAYAFMYCYTLAYKYARLTLGILGKIMFGIIYDTIATWTAETYPTFLRSVEEII